jgi:hypothetical protein
MQPNETEANTTQHETEADAVEISEADAAETDEANATQLEETDAARIEIEKAIAAQFEAAIAARTEELDAFENEIRRQLQKEYDQKARNLERMATERVVKAMKEKKRCEADLKKQLAASEAKLEEQLAVKDAELKKAKAEAQEARAEVEKQRADSAAKSNVHHQLLARRDQQAQSEKHIANEQVVESFDEKYAIIAERDVLIAEGNAIIADRVAIITQMDAILAQGDAIISRKNAVIAERDAALQQLEIQREAFEAKLEEAKIALEERVREREEFERLKHEDTLPLAAPTFTEEDVKAMYEEGKLIGFHDHAVMDDFRFAVKNDPVAWQHDPRIRHLLSKENERHPFQLGKKVSRLLVGAFYSNAKGMPHRDLRRMKVTGEPHYPVVPKEKRDTAYWRGYLEGLAEVKAEVDELVEKRG